MIAGVMTIEREGVVSCCMCQESVRRDEAYAYSKAYVCRDCATDKEEMYGRR